MVDWGSFSIKDATKTGVAALVGNGRGPYKMARTLSPSSANQVRDAGRKIITAWLDGGGFGQGQVHPAGILRVGQLVKSYSPCELRRAVAETF